MSQRSMLLANTAGAQFSNAARKGSLPTFYFALSFVQVQLALLPPCHVQRNQFFQFIWD